MKLKLKKYVLTKDLTTEECPWFANLDITRIDKGTTVYEFPDVYDCSGGEGTTVSFEKAKYPYFEVPLDAIQEVFGADFSVN